ncbi:MAG: SIS domain-containing protein [Deltaproteobacteria bacterium]|nr:SIS domain-containing protein [Deltaproteobacteria bacterium]MBW2071316.1 SIS domain-containing protein [Deltaproteobacteria bacterium]
MQRLEPRTGVRQEKLQIQEKIDRILGENRHLLQSLREDAVVNFIQRIDKAHAIFFSAQGRSGFVLRCFCMRLMHLGYRVYFCGETITPAIGKGDLLMVLSGSGETPSTFEAVQIAKRRSAMTFGILGNMNGRIAALVDHSICLPGTTKLCRDCEPGSLQLAGSLFEQAAFIFLEAVVVVICQQRVEAIGDVSQLHAVIE